MITTQKNSSYQDSNDTTYVLIVTQDSLCLWYGEKKPPMFIKLRAKRFWGRLTVQERGAGLGDIFTQNTLSAIKAVCQVLGLSLCGQGGERGSGKRGEERGRFSMETTSWEAAAAHTRVRADTHTKGFFLPAYTAHIIALHK